MCKTSVDVREGSGTGAELVRKLLRRDVCVLHRYAFTEGLYSSFAHSYQPFLNRDRSLAAVTFRQLEAFWAVGAACLGTPFKHYLRLRMKNASWMKARHTGL